MGVIGKVKGGIKGGISSPARFIVSLGIGFALGVILDLIMEYVYRNFLAGTIEGQLGSRWEVGFPFYMGHDVTSIAWDDVIMLIITVFMLFSRKFVTTLGFFLGWYLSSCYGWYQQIEELPQ